MVISKTIIGIGVGVPFKGKKKKTENPDEKYLEISPQFLWVDVDIPAVVEVTSNTDWNVL